MALKETTFIVSVLFYTCSAVKVTIGDLGDIIEGSKTRMACNIVRDSPSSTADPIIIWNNVTGGGADRIATFQSGTSVLESGYVGKFDVDVNDGSIVIANTLRSYSGIYQCSVTILDDGSGEDDVLLHVIYLETVLTFTTPVIEGDRVELLCTTVANPAPVITFKKDGVIEQQGGDPTLTYNPVARTDAGNYECEVMNGAGTKSTASQMLEVYYIVDVMIDISSTTDPYFNITCSVDGNPVPQLDLYHNNTIIKTETAMNLTYTRSTVTEDDSGEYYCKASNTVGPVMSNIIILNCYRPEFELPQYMVACFGDDVVIAISSMSANPNNVTYQWAIDDPDIRDTDTNPATFSFTVSGDVNSIYVISLDVENVIGSKTDSITIIVSSSCCSVSENGNKSSKGLAVGMVFVRIFIGAFGVIIGHIGYTKIKQKKLTDNNKISRKTNDKKQEAYTEYITEPSSPTYQDLQQNRVHEESAYVNVKTTKNNKTQQII